MQGIYGMSSAVINIDLVVIRGSKAQDVSLGSCRDDEEHICPIHLEGVLSEDCGAALQNGVWRSHVLDIGHLQWCDMFHSVRNC